MVKEKSMVLSRSTSIHCTLMPVLGSNSERVSNFAICFVLVVVAGVMIAVNQLDR